MGPQEQPTNQPVQQPPVVPVSPAPAQTQPGVSAVPPTSPQRANKGLLWGIIGGVVALLVATGIVLAFTVFSAPSKDDYQKASTAAKDITQAYNSAGTKFGTFVSRISSSFASKSSTESAKTDFVKAYDDYKSKVDAFKDQKALKNADVKKVYDEFVKKNDAFRSFVDGFQSSADALVSMQETCSGDNASDIGDYASRTVLDAYDRVLSPCMKDLETVAKSSNSTLADYAKQTIDLYKKQRQLFSDLEDANKSGSVAAQNSARSAIVAQSSDFYEVSDYSKKFVSGIKDNDPETELKALSSELSKKASN